MNLIDKLIKHLKKSIPNCLITGYNPDSEESTKFSISLSNQNKYGFTYHIKIAEISWAYNEPIVTFFPNNSVYQERLPAILDSFNPHD